MDKELNQNNKENLQDVIHVSGMYKQWFLDYASYVILERSVPYIEDGLKPVQRRILHALKELDDGRYHKVANVIGHTMKYHPHGDASIGDALVQVGQKNLLLDMQGNWGNTATGDRAAAPRYIEVRLSKLAMEVLFNTKITDWTSSYDGRSKEPIILPVKFPLLLAHGVEGIAVGLSTKIMPHNFNELIAAFKKILEEHTNVQLLLVGNPEEELDPMLPETEEFIFKSDKVIATGWADDVRPYFAISDCLTFPSYREGFPNVVMQSGAMGLYSIVSDINGCNEIVKEGVNGTIIPTKNTEALFNAMKHVLDNKEKFATEKGVYREMIKKRYERSFIWNELLKEYQELEGTKD